MSISVLVFDLDDTLYPERDFVLSGFSAVDRWLQVEIAVAGFAAAAWRHFSNGSRGRVFDAALAELGVPPTPELVAAMVAVYRAHPPAVALLPDARWALRHFRGRARLGLLTDGYAATQRNKVAALALAPWLDVTVFTDDHGREHWKPSPLGFEHVMRTLRCRGADCAYVGDNPAKDFAAPNRLGWRTIQVLRPGGEYAGRAATPLPPSHAPGAVISSLHELAPLLA